MIQLMPTIDGIRDSAAQYPVKEVLVNLGCGTRHHPDWINIDIVPHESNVIAHDLRMGIPLPDDSCDVVYHSNMLEHFRRPDALRLLDECLRVLKPGGILRVAVPDLEHICHVYLEKLEKARQGCSNADYDYEWILLEMYDQTVREHSGGGMITYLSQSPMPNEEFVFERIGVEGQELVEQTQPQTNSQNQESNPGRSKRLQVLIHRIHNSFRYNVLRLLLGSAGIRALEIGRFRLSGEVHHWMYDEFSLAQLMRSAGFCKVARQSALESRVSDWQRFNLDTLPNGTVIKPDSLFMEAVKP